MAKNKIKIILSLLAGLLPVWTASSADIAGKDDSVLIHTVGDILHGVPARMNSHTGMEKWSILQPMCGYPSVIPHSFLTGEVPEEQKTAMYPRIKKMADGRYIMFYHGGATGSRIWAVTSNDFREWSDPVLLYEPVRVDVNSSKDWRRFVNMDALVMPDGEILAVCAYRAEASYIRGLGCGLMLTRSRDNGRTWSDPQRIYDGPVWEPYLMLLPDGRIHCYFTDPVPQNRNSGTSLIISEDGGKTWGLKARVCRQYKYDYDGPSGALAGAKIYTDQMPCFRVLNDGETIFGFIEARVEEPAADSGKSKYRLSAVWNDSLEWKDLGETGAGPSTRIDNFISGGGGYVSTFPSGEVVISGHINGVFQYKILDHTADRGNTDSKTWAEGWTAPFSGKGYWSCTEVDSPLSLVAAMHCKEGIETGRFFLNHCLEAFPKEVTVDGNPVEWADFNALYLGCGRGDGTILRAGCDGGNLYLLTETSCLSSVEDVRLDLMLCKASRKDVCTVRISGSGSVLSSDRVVQTAFSRGASSDGCPGFSVEMKIPYDILKLQSGDEVCIYAVMASDGSSVAFTGSEKSNPQTWQRIRIK